MTIKKEDEWLVKGWHDVMVISSSSDTKSQIETI